MSQYALLTLDLDGADSAQRKKFDSEMPKGWKKQVGNDGITTTWTGSFKDDVDAVSSTKAHVQRAAKAAKITSFDAIVSVSPVPPTKF